MYNVQITMKNDNKYNNKYMQLSTWYYYDYNRKELYIRFKGQDANS